MHLGRRANNGLYYNAIRAIVIIFIQAQFARRKRVLMSLKSYKTFNVLYQNVKVSEPAAGAASFRGAFSKVFLKIN